jgi:N-glycosylase/DNA lyase
MGVNSIRINGPFDMRNSIESGQPLTFHAECSTKGKNFHTKYVTPKGVISTGFDGKLLKYSWEGSYNRKSAKAEVERRFSINDDMESIYSRINTDGFMESAISAYNGMRVTKNDPWETTLCFILSQFNNIKRIRGSVKMLINSYGTPLEESDAKLFPSAEQIREASINDLMRHGAGFRAKYIKHAAEYCSDNLDLDSLHKMTYSDAKESIMEINGVGDKVADCIMLFAYNKMEAFPIDVWIKRVLEAIYFDGKKKKIKELHEFAEEKWPGLEGYAQQYLFWHARSMKIKVK